MELSPCLVGLHCSWETRPENHLDQEKKEKTTQHSLSLFSENYDPYVHTKTFEIKAHNNSYEL